VAAPFDHFLGNVATGLGNFVVPAGLRVHQISSLSIVACLSLSRRGRANPLLRLLGADVDLIVLLKKELK